MIAIDKLVEINIPCRDKLTGLIETFTVLAYNFHDAEKKLEYILDMRWEIGYGSF